MSDKNPDTPLLVLSASRRTDLVACYPDAFIERLAQHPPDSVHTIVIWTKNPANMINPGPLRNTLTTYRQLYVHLTVTGLGASVLEPNIPDWHLVADMVPELVRLVRDPRRISWRFDPIVRAETFGGTITNAGLFGHIAPGFAACGVTTCRTSWVEPYRKVLRRTLKHNITLRPHTDTERRELSRQLEKQAAALGITIQYCSMGGFARSACIDGRLLRDLHPDTNICSVKRARGQRRLCGCTESLDIGWYSQKCRNGCVYCYAEPLLE